MGPMRGPTHTLAHKHTITNLHAHTHIRPHKTAKMRYILTLAAFLAPYLLSGCAGDMPPPPPVDNLSLYEFTSFWYQMAVASRPHSHHRPTELACIQTDFDCYPRHCDPNTTTLAFTTTATDSAGSPIMPRNGFAVVPDGSTVAAKRVPSLPHPPPWHAIPCSTKTSCRIPPDVSSLHLATHWFHTKRYCDGTKKKETLPLLLGY